MEVVLPRYVAIQSKATGKYLCYLPQEDSECFKFAEDNVVNPYVKFEVHASKTGHGSLAHFRCVYGSNKYVAVVNDSDWSLGVVNKEEEDQSKKSCTLFRPTNTDNDVGDDGKEALQIRLMHVHVGRNLSSSKKSSNHDVFRVVNYDSVVVLPQYVAFKGDNGKYLKATRLYDDLHYLLFAGTDIGSSEVGEQISTLSDGNICLKNNYWGDYWTDVNWIRCESSSTDDNRAHFKPIQVNDNTVALKSITSNLFCRRLSVDQSVDALNAYAKSIEVYAKMVVEERVVSREIYDVSFRLKDARIYNVVPVIFVEKEASNYSSQPQQIQLELEYQKTHLKSWNNSLTVKVGVTASTSVNIPFIGDTQIEISAEVARDWSWGESDTTSLNVTSTNTTIVNPNKKVTVKVIATTGYCDVPFSYTQRDTLYSGETVTYTKDDGLYTGANAYNISTVTTEEDI